MGDRLKDAMEILVNFPHKEPEPWVRVWIDCEWNDWGGDLISMALVTEGGREFYQSLGCNNPSRWVAANVMPVIGADSVSREQFQSALWAFIGSLGCRVEVVADWPEDIAWLCRMLCAPGGKCVRPDELRCTVRSIPGSSSLLPHNALFDAWGNRNADVGIILHSKEDA